MYSLEKQRRVLLNMHTQNYDPSREISKASL